MLRSLGRLMVVALVICPLTAAADVVTDWNEVVLDAIRTDQTAPPKAARALAMVHIAIYDAVNAVDGTHEAYLVATSPPAGTSAEAAAATAAHRVLVALFPAQQATLDAGLETSLAAIANGISKNHGVALGESVADQVLAARADDHSADVVEYIPGSDVGDWQPIPPAFAASLLPNWPSVTPFAMTGGAQFRDDGPPALDSAEYATAFNEVKELGRVASTVRTDDQTETVLFWANGPGTSTPPGHWNSIAQRIAATEGNTVVENARLFALLNIAGADAAIVSWDNKYAYNHWRPVTAIPNADLDGNAATELETDWAPQLSTPPFPEYTSGHSTFSGAASKILELFYGTDDISFATNSDGLPDAFRDYTSFSQAADESGQSRIYGGIHFQYANEDGLSSGRALAEYINSNYLKAIQTDGGGRPRLCGIFGLGSLLALMAMLSTLGLLRSRRRD